MIPEWMSRSIPLPHAGGSADFAKNNFKVRASVFCFSKERAQTRAQAARSFLEGLKPASPRTALLRVL